MIHYTDFGGHVWGEIDEALGITWSVVSPGCRPFFSERYGFIKPKLKLFGWRLFVSRLP